MPTSDNRSCRLGLRLDLLSKQKTELADIGWNSTTHEKYVNALNSTHLDKKIFQMSTHTGNSNFVFRLYDLKNLSIDIDRPAGFSSQPRRSD
jgi:hypothetical protein